MKKLTAGLCLAAMLMMPAAALAHCEIPCGIYGDEARFTEIAEDITTVEKSMKMITKLSAAKAVNYNQLVRWVNNKEAHANKIQHVVTQYFMTQRIKPAKDKAGQEAYVKKLVLLHTLLRGAMKAKQSTDPKVCASLRNTLAKFKAAYMAK